MYDVIVVGAGINGLTCAAYLSKAGKRVLVLEANPQPGGFTITEQTPGAPEGFKINTYAIEFPFADMKPSVVEELGLARFGLRFTHPDPHNTYIGPDGTQFSNYFSLDETCRSIARLSHKDGEAWRHLMTSLGGLADVGMPYLSDHPTRPSPATLAEIVGQAAKHRKRLLPAARILMQTPNEILDEFESDEVRAWLASERGDRQLPPSRRGREHLDPRLLRLQPPAPDPPPRGRFGRVHRGPDRPHPLPRRRGAYLGSGGPDPGGSGQNDGCRSRERGGDSRPRGSSGRSTRPRSSPS